MTTDIAYDGACTPGTVEPGMDGLERLGQDAPDGQAHDPLHTRLS